MKYQDFVIKDGKFIGKFDDMYKQHEDPWHQSEIGYVENSFSRFIVTKFIKKYQIKSLIEVGCGLGNTTNFIHQETGSKILGIDISETAINKAKVKFPYLSFQVGDVLDIGKYADSDAVFFSEITWYLLEDKLLDRSFSELLRVFKGKYFIHTLVFYKGQQRYGLNYFKNLEEFINFCPFQLVSKIEVNFQSEDCIETATIFKI